MAIQLQRSQGLTESHLSTGTGLRNHSYVAMLVTSDTDVVNAISPTKGTSTFVAATLNNGRINYPSTLTIKVVQSAGVTTGTMIARIRGVDQFGQAVEEVTPSVVIKAVTNNWVYCAQVFATVTEFAYIITGLGTTTVSVGQHWDFVRTIDASNEHIAGQNLGLGLPSLFKYRPRGDTGNLTGTFKADRVTFPAPTRAFAVLTVAALPADGETVTIDGVIYRYKAALAAAFDVLIGATTTTACQNLYDAINRTGTAGTQYHSGTSAHPTVGATAVGSTSVTVGARNPGADGNLISVSETLAGVGNQWSGTTLDNGQSDTGEVTGVVLQDLSAGGTILNVSPFDWTVGMTLSGWVGSIEKLSIFKTRGAGTYVVGDTGLLTIQMQSRDLGW